MRRVFGLVLSVCFLAGCTAPVPPPLPTETVVIPPEPAHSWPPTSSAPPVAPANEGVDSRLQDSMTCEPPTRGVMAWLREPTRYPYASESQTWVVFASEGLQAGELWWIVVTNSDPSSWGRHSATVFLTNELSPSQPSRPTWLLVAERTSTGIVKNYWVSIPWKGECLALGKAAQAKALTCLPLSS